MLDELPLSTKLMVARDWFRRSQAGEFPLTGGTADRFSELLLQCRDEALKLQAAAGAPVIFEMSFDEAEPAPAVLSAVRDEIERLAKQQELARTQ